MRQEPSWPHPTLTPEYLAQTGPWSVDSWRAVYATYGHRREWPKLAQLGQTLHPNQLHVLAAGMMQLSAAVNELATADLTYLRAHPDLATFEHWLDAMYGMAA